MTKVELICEQIKAFPEPILQELLDFMGYLKEKQAREGLRDLMLAQEDSLRAIWDNDEDEVWNEI